MHLYLERCPSARSDCPIHALSWMGKVPDDMPEVSDGRVIGGVNGVMGGEG